MKYFDSSVSTTMASPLSSIPQFRLNFSPSNFCTHPGKKLHQSTIVSCLSITVSWAIIVCGVSCAHKYIISTICCRDRWLAAKKDSSWTLWRQCMPDRTIACHPIPGHSAQAMQVGHRTCTKLHSSRRRRTNHARHLWGFDSSGIRSVNRQRSCAIAWNTAQWLIRPWR